MSKVIFKVTFKNPNFKRASAYNVAHLNYIATRPGVDKTVTASDLEKELSGRVELTDEEYAQYINERPKSHGLFDAYGVADINKVKQEISQNRGFIYRAIVSLREEDALRLGYINKENWQDLIRQKMPDIAYEMNIRLDNLRWVAAFHMKKGHPHAHVMIWEKEPERISGKISKKSINQIRKIFTDEIFHEEKLLNIQEKNAMRELIREQAVKDMKGIRELIKGIKELEEEVKIFAADEIKDNIPPRMPLDVEEYLKNRLIKLSDMLPEKGSIKFDYMPEDVKKEVLEIAHFLLNTVQYKSHIERYLNAVKKNAELYTGNQESIQKVLDNAYFDIQKRVSQTILRSVLDIYRWKHSEVYFISGSIDNSSANVKTLTNNIVTSTAYELWKSISGYLETLNKKEELMSLRHKQKIARYAALDSKKLRREVAKNLSHSGLYQDIDT